MTRSERWLVILLRLVGVSCLLALVGVVMPVDWMADCHEQMGLGAFPRAPVVDYLVRSVSALYMAGGGLMLLVSTDLARYRPVVTYLVFVFIVLGAAILVIDIINALPWWWTYPEGLGTIAVGVVILALNRGTPVEERPS